MKHRDGYVQKDIVVFKKKKKKNRSDFHCSYPVLDIASFESRVSNLDDYRAFSTTFFEFFSTFSTFTLPTRRSGHMTPRMRGMGGGGSNTLFFELQCDHVGVLKCVSYLKYGRFAEAKKVCRGLTHFVSRCSIAIT